MNAGAKSYNPSTQKAEVEVFLILGQPKLHSKIVLKEVERDWRALAEWLTALAALSKDPRFNLQHPCGTLHTSVCNSSSRGSNTLF